MSCRAATTPHLFAAALLALAACDSTVEGGGGGAGGGGETGGGAGAIVVGTGTSSATTVTSAETVGAGNPTTTGAGSGPGDLPTDVTGVIVPGDDELVDFLLANAPQSCVAPLEEVPCASGDRWLARVRIPAEDLAVGTYELGGARMGISVEESSDDCSGWGMRGWDAEPAWLTIESIDAAHAVITIEGAYDDVDGTWDVPLCAGVTPAP